MKRIILLFAMVVATVVNVMAQEYFGQPLVVKLASGDSLIAEMCQYGIAPRYENGEVVWHFQGTRDYPVKNVNFINLRSHKQSEAIARQSLIKFYKAMDGDHWYNNTNWCSDKPIGEWFGVLTLNRPYVWLLDLQNNHLKGKLPDDGTLMGFGPCVSFALNENEISGAFPKDWTKDMDIQYLDIFTNQISGQLPGKFFELPLLHGFKGNENNMTGPIPGEMAFLMDEKNRLNIAGNDFSGEVPEAIVNHPRFHLMWNDLIPQRGHLTLPTIPGYRLSVEDTGGNKLETTDIYKNNLYTLIFNYASARGSFTDKLKQAYTSYKQKGFEVLGMAPGDLESVNEYLHTNGITWMNLDPDSFGDAIGKYYMYLNFINLVDQNGNVVFSSIMDENGKMEDTWGSSTRDQMVFDVLAKKFGSVDFTPYTSTDFSRDGETMTLQRASVGKGFDIVFVGNAFTDKDMAPGGFYEKKMKEAMEQFFAYEPYTSLRNRFNVYAVKAVSPNAELYENCKQAIMTDADAFNYAKKVKDLNTDRPLCVNIIYNSFNAGRSFTTWYDDNSYLAFMFTGVNRVLNHEGGGHGIGKLYDEYVETPGVTAPQDVKDYYEQMWTEFGYGANIDMHSDVTKTRWSRLAADKRYAVEELGAYEGSGTYEYGIYRPTKNSMMRYNDTPFNAPSREAIYKIVMKETEGSNWKYDYETFVKFDANGRAQFAEALPKEFSAMPSTNEVRPADKAEKVDKQSLTLPPVRMKGTWRDAVEHPTPISELSTK